MERQKWYLSAPVPRPISICPHGGHPLLIPAFLLARHIHGLKVLFISALSVDFIHTNDRKQPLHLKRKDITSPLSLYFLDNER